MLTFWLREFERLRADRRRFVAVVLLLVATGYVAGTVVRGSATSIAPSLQHPVSQSPKPVYAGIIQPILQRRCVNCHGPKKQKAALRLDSLAGLRQGGQDGPVLQPGNASNSLLIQRLFLPLDAAHHMPPEGQPQLSAEEIDLIVWWTNAGATPEATTADVKPSP
jgi:mono/diheme cytochrome c family protein